MKALVVDDNEDLRFLIAHLLSLDGFEIVQAANGNQAIDAVGSDPSVDVVLLDVQMPVADGWQALSAIRNRHDWDRIRVVMCTVKGRAEDLIRGWELGCDGFVTKPFDIEAFRTVVREVLDRDDLTRRQLRETEARRARAMSR